MLCHNREVYCFLNTDINNFQYVQNIIIACGISRIIKIKFVKNVNWFWRFSSLSSNVPHSKISSKCSACGFSVPFASPSRCRSQPICSSRPDSCPTSARCRTACRSGSRSTTCWTARTSRS
uniref:(northern house mosquito) hypothetical protein n=1 Tax=Culex pipiens TaxID=7175 RepID=A0A8D8P836_CULPI